VKHTEYFVEAPDSEKEKDGFPGGIRPLSVELVVKNYDLLNFVPSNDIPAYVAAVIIPLLLTV
jgi:hypothetical protein